MESKVIQRISYENLAMIIESMAEKVFGGTSELTIGEFTDHLWENASKEYALFEIKV